MRTQPDWSHVTTIREALAGASSLLREAGAKDAMFEAELLIRHTLNWDRTRFLTSMTEPIPAEAVDRLAALCQRRAENEPLQYIFGSQEFYGRPFTVGPGVLIPRPETEILVEHILRKADEMWEKDSPLRVADIGTGSGAICITLACERPSWDVATVDISADASRIAQENARLLGADIRFLLGDLVEPLVQEGSRLDILVSNPPYIPSRDVDELDEEVRGFEPRLALDGGDDGLDFYRRLSQALPILLREKAIVAFEVGIHQAQAVAGLLQATGMVSETEIICDLAGIERVVMGIRK